MKMIKVFTNLINKGIKAINLFQSLDFKGRYPALFGNN